VRALERCLFASSAWAQSATVVVGTTVEDAVLASVRLTAWAQPANVVSVTTFEDALLPLFDCRRGPNQPLWWRARNVRALLMPLFARSA
jgi:hypothetical protein